MFKLITYDHFLACLTSVSMNPKKCDHRLLRRPTLGLRFVCGDVSFSIKRSKNCNRLKLFLRSCNCMISCKIVPTILFKVNEPGLPLHSSSATQIQTRFQPACNWGFNREVSFELSSERLDSSIAPISESTACFWPSSSPCSEQSKL